MGVFYNSAKSINYNLVESRIQYYSILFFKYDIIRNFRTLKFAAIIRYGASPDKERDKTASFKKARMLFKNNYASQ